MTLAIIGGTGLTQISELEITGQHTLDTPFGSPSADFLQGDFNGTSVIFLARHGNPHTIPPHKINYRANLWGLKQLGVSEIIAVAAVGGITPAMKPARIIIPDQIIDYSYGREHTFFSENLTEVTHIDFTGPYTESLRQRLLLATKTVAIDSVDYGVYGCTQGPRLETSAEVRRMQQDGCDLVGMTGMPEAALARELEIDYAALAVIANWAAGKSEGIITMAEIEENLRQGMADTVRVLQAFLISNVCTRQN
jgi:5'-methylthioinosine phosphorylase